MALELIEGEFGVDLLLLDAESIVFVQFVLAFLAVPFDLGIEDPLLELAMELEDMALKDQYFIDKRLYPNVDFYSGIILKAMGFPTSMFTVLFAVARTVGWVAQWNEMITDPMQRIGRPRQLYTGPTERPFVDISKR